MEFRKNGHQPGKLISMFVENCRVKVRVFLDYEQSPFPLRDSQGKRTSDWANRKITRVVET